VQKRTLVHVPATDPQSLTLYQTRFKSKQVGEPFEIKKGKKKAGMVAAATDGGGGAEQADFRLI
jgi:hypothetical protein